MFPRARRVRLARGRAGRRDGDDGGPARSSRGASAGATTTRLRRAARTRSRDPPAARADRAMPVAGAGMAARVARPAAPAARAAAQAARPDVAPTNVLSRGEAAFRCACSTRRRARSAIASSRNDRAGHRPASFRRRESHPQPDAGARDGREAGGAEQRIASVTTALHPARPPRSPRRYAPLPRTCSRRVEVPIRRYGWPSPLAGCVTWQASVHCSNARHFQHGASPHRHRPSPAMWRL